MKLLLGLGIFGLLTSTIFTAIVFAGVRKFVVNRSRRKLQAPPVFAPPVTLLKPLHGAEQTEPTATHSAPPSTAAFPTLMLVGMLVS